MFRRTVYLLVTFCVFAANPTAYAHNVRIYNDTDVELDIKVFHFDDLTKVWKVGKIDDGKRSEVVDLAHGDRILVARDAVTGDVVLTYSFKMGDMGRRVRLSGTSPDIQVYFTRSGTALLQMTGNSA